MNEVTFPAPSLPPATEFASFTQNYAWPEAIRWFLFAGGVLLVVMALKRLTAK